jgi:opacity protein-like surface antigen
MFFRLNVRLLLAALFVTAAIPVTSQVVPAATQGGWPLEVGGGVADYYPELANYYLKGPTAWIDVAPFRHPQLLHGLGLEGEARDLNYGQPANSRLRLYTFGGGPIYTWRHFRNFHPYGKFAVDYGAMDFNIHVPHYTHDYWTIYAAGGGVEYRVWRNVWARGDYEYQFWRVGFRGNSFLNPEGATLGVSYDLKILHRH